MPTKTAPTKKAPAAKKAPPKKAPARKAPAAKKAPAKRPAKKAAATPAAPETFEQPMLVEYFAIDRVKPNPANIRDDLGDLTELAESIADVGIRVPAIVYRLAGDPDFDVMLLGGHRRRAAALIAGVTEMPAIVRAKPDRVEELEEMLRENNDRKGLNPIEEAKALLEMKKAGRSVAKIAARVHRSSKWVSDRIALVEKLPETMWTAIAAGELSVTDATMIATTKGLTDRERKTLADVDEDLRDRKAKELAEKAKLRALKDKIAGELPGRKIETVDYWQNTGPTGSRFGAVRYGTKPGEITTPAAWHDAEHQVVQLRKPQPTWHSSKPKPATWEVWNTAPELLPPDSFAPFPDQPEPDDGAVLQNEDHVLEVGDDLLADAEPVARIERRVWLAGCHQFCDYHRRVAVPWSTHPLEVCLKPEVHDPEKGGQVNGEELRRRWRAANPASTAAPEPVRYEPVWTEAQEAVLLQALGHVITQIPVGLFLPLGETALPDISIDSDGATLDDPTAHAQLVLRAVARSLAAGTGVEPGQSGEDAPTLHWIAATLIEHDVDLPPGLARAIGLPHLELVADVDEDLEVDA